MSDRQNPLRTLARALSDDNNNDNNDESNNSARPPVYEPVQAQNAASTLLPELPWPEHVQTSLIDDPRIRDVAGRAQEGNEVNADELLAGQFDMMCHEDLAEDKTVSANEAVPNVLESGTTGQRESTASDPSEPTQPDATSSQAKYGSDKIPNTPDRRNPISEDQTKGAQQSHTSSLPGPQATESQRKARPRHKVNLASRASNRDTVDPRLLSWRETKAPECTSVVELAPFDLVAAGRDERGRERRPPSKRIHNFFARYQGNADGDSTFIVFSLRDARHHGRPRAGAGEFWDFARLGRRIARNTARAARRHNNAPRRAGRSVEEQPQLQQQQTELVQEVVDKDTLFLTNPPPASPDDLMSLEELEEVFNTPEFS
ncbi:hypothetical protein PVAG01_03936 [Phlyctema vagabunda]|uniref:Uncharacterized protein n=1 Tax=Phlyctema vagabunda TaxID=108571 RepID=A0ABR4PMY9_9HELO